MSGAITGEWELTDEEKERGSASAPREISPTFQPWAAESEF